MIEDDLEHGPSAATWRREHVGHRHLSPGQMAARLRVRPEQVEAYLRALGHKWHAAKEPYFPPEVFSLVKKRFAG